MADRLDDLYIKLTTGKLQVLLVWVTLCSNRAATRANVQKPQEKHHTNNMLVCRGFAISRNLRKSVTLL
jgi:hypothetical protein